jgi:hypothetical protein
VHMGSSGALTKWSGSPAVANRGRYMLLGQQGERRPKLRLADFRCRVVSTSSMEITGRTTSEGLTDSVAVSNNISMIGTLGSGTGSLVSVFGRF